MKKPAAVAIAPEEPPPVVLLLSPDHAARALDVSRSKVYKMMRARELAYVMIGADRRIPVAEVERLAARGTSTA